MPWRVRSLSLAVALGTVSVAVAQPADPVAVTDSFLVAFLAQDWRTAGRFLDSARLEARRREYLNNPATWGPPQGITAADYRRRDSTLSSEVAEYLARRAAASLANRIAIPEFGIDSIEVLARLTTAELATAWLKARDPRTAIAQQLAAAGCPNSPAIDSLFASGAAAFHGGVPVGSDRAVVLYDIRWNGLLTRVDEQPPPLVQLTLSAGRWRIVPALYIDIGLQGIGMPPDCRPR